MMKTSKRSFLAATFAALAVTAAPVVSAPARAADAVKVGVILPMTGPFASTGRQVSAGLKLYMQQNGDTVGRQEDRDDPEGRWRRAGPDEASGAGTDRQ